MKLMIDTNVILDVLLERSDFYANSKAVLDLCENKKILGFVSASSITDIFYLVRRALRDTDETYKVIGALLNIISILNVTQDDIQRAFLRHAKDFEDCLLAECAKSNNCAGIVTRDKITLTLLIFLQKFRSFSLHSTHLTQPAPSILQ